jgi:hypothetical protein
MRRHLLSQDVSSKNCMAVVLSHQNKQSREIKDALCIEFPSVETLVYSFSYWETCHYTNFAKEKKQKL